MNQTNACIQLKDVSRAYGDHRHAHEVVRNCSLDIEHGKVTVLIGPSGCGKSTLIRLIAGFEKPTSGSVLHNGKAVTRPDKGRLVLFQESALFPWMSTDENVMYGPQARGEARPQTRHTAAALIQRVGLQSFRNKYPGQLSGGMQRRAELARALINNPQLMILDEPFRGLDAMTKSLMQEYFAELIQETRLTVLFVTTDVDEAIFLADRLVIMANIPTSVRRIMDVEIPPAASADRPGGKRRRQPAQDAGFVAAARGGNALLRQWRQGVGRFRRCLRPPHRAPARCAEHAA